MDKNTRWPSVFTTSTDKGIIRAIAEQDGYLQNIDTKDLLLIAAAIAVKNEIPRDGGIDIKRSEMSEAISYANLNSVSYNEYRQYISAIYYTTKADKNVDNMKDVGEMVKNFEDYAHRGIIYLKENYLNNKDGNKELFDDYVDYLSRSIKK